MARSGRDFTRDVARKADRKAAARRREKHDVWSWLGMFGLVGWAVAVPTLIGVAIGVWLDTRYPGRVSWTLTLLFVGVVLGCLNAWHWVTRESRDD
jgi:ATP synthase protein I